MKAKKSDPLCRLCGKPVGPHNPDFLDPAPDMHHICYHIAFEHDTDPDQPCQKITFLQFLLQTYREKLATLGVDADDVVEEALQKSIAKRKNSA
jgi:hypothetical protein